MNKAKTLILSFAMITALIVINMTSAFAETEDIVPDTKAAILYEETTDTVIYEKNADMQLPPASMTKVMTALIVLEANPELEGELTVDERAVNSYYCSWKDAATCLKAKEKISYEDCMRTMLISSANEATCAFAFDMCDEYSDFVDKMNAKVEELGLKNTHFFDTSGLSYLNYTCPRDMCIIAREAMKYEKFREIVKMKKGVLPVSNMRDKPTEYWNSNLLLNPDKAPYKSEYNDFVIGVKTGWIPESKNCFTGCMQRDGLTFYTVVMGSEDVQINGEWVQGSFTDTIKLYQYADSFDPEKALAAKRRPIIIGAVAIAAVIAAVIVIVMKRKKAKSK